MAEIVIVEDDEDIRLTTIEFLEMEGFSVVGCVNGEEALSYLGSRREHLPKLLLVDINMPVMNGHAFRLKQMEDPVLNTVPCVLMSANGDDGSRNAALGIQDYLRKPIDLDQMIEIVQRYLKH